MGHDDGTTTRWLCVGEAFERPFARSFEPSDKTDDLLLKASQQFECSSEEPVQQAARQEMLLEPEKTDVIDELLLQASQQFEWSFVVPEEPVKAAARSRSSDPVTVGDVVKAPQSGVAGSL